MEQNGGVLIHAAGELRMDQELVLEALKQEGCALENSSDELQMNREVALEAAKQRGQHTSIFFR